MILSVPTTERKTMAATGKTEPGVHHFVRTRQAPVAVGQRSLFREPSVTIVAHGNVTRMGGADGDHTYLRSGASIELPAALIPELIEALTLAYAEATADPAQLVMEAVR